MKALDTRYDPATRRHARRVAASALLETPEERTAALLHDVVEDGLARLDEVRAAHGDEVAELVDAVTRRPGETYADSIDRAAEDLAAARIKLADVRDNLSGRKTPPPGRLAKRYRKAERVLRAAISGLNFVDSEYARRLCRLKRYLGRPAAWGLCLRIVRSEGRIYADVHGAAPKGSSWTGGRFLYPRDRVVFPREVPAEVSMMYERGTLFANSHPAAPLRRRQP